VERPSHNGRRLFGGRLSKGFPFRSYPLFGAGKSHNCLIAAHVIGVGIAIWSVLEAVFQGAEMDYGLGAR